MRAAIYIRVSTLDQAREGYSLAAQERTLVMWCSEHGYEVYGIYPDEGISGKDIDHRPAMMRLLADASDASDRKFDLILVWALSRFTRSVADLYNSLALFERYNIDLVSFTESFDTSTPMGRAMVGIVGVFAQLERELTSERVRVAMEERAVQGKRTCSAVLGYDVCGPDSLTINIQEAEIVQYIFDRFLEYRNLSAVAELCELRGYHGKRGRPFRAQHIRKILTRPIYAGYNSQKGKAYKGLYEPIISVQKYNRVQKIIEKTTRGRKLKHPLIYL